MRRFARRAAEAANDKGEAKDALASMGIALRDQDGNLCRSEDLLGDVAERFRGAFCACSLSLRLRPFGFIDSHSEHVVLGARGRFLPGIESDHEDQREIGDEADPNTGRQDVYPVS